MNNDPDRAFYGYKHVQLALEAMAIDTLMVSDVLFRSRNILQRKKYVKLVEDARDQGVNTLIFSSMHVTGEQLAQLTGVAAILRFPIEGVDDFTDDEPIDLPDETWTDGDIINTTISPEPTSWALKWNSKIHINFVKAQDNPILTNPHVIVVTMFL